MSLIQFVDSSREGSCVLQSSKCGLRGCRVGEASNPGLRVKKRRRESSVSETESDVDFLAGLEEDLGVVLTLADPATTQLSSTVAGIHSPRHREQHFVRCIEVEHCLPVLSPICQVFGRLQGNPRIGSPR